MIATLETPAAEELSFRPATPLDVSAMAEVRSEKSGNAPDWERTIAAYLSGENNPRQSLHTRVAILAERNGQIVGFIAGHLTHRYHCDGEIQWINFSDNGPDPSVATRLLREMADWFASYDARRICVIVQPRNDAARAFYTRHGAEPLNDHWMVWPDISRAVLA